MNKIIITEKQLIDLRKSIVNEIKIVNPGFYPGPIIAGIFTVNTEFGPVGNYVELIDIGNYYTLIPSGGQEYVVLFPKNLIKVFKLLETDSKKYFDYIIELLKQRKIEIAKESINEIKIAKPKSYDYFDISIIDNIKNVLDKKIKEEIQSLSEDIDSIIFYHFGNAMRYIVIEHMIANSYEITLDGNEFFVSYNNEELVDDDEIFNYIKNNFELYDFLKNTILKFHYEEMKTISPFSIYKKCEKSIEKIFSRLGEYDEYPEYEINEVIETTIEDDLSDFELDYDDHEKILKKEFDNSNIF